MWVDRAHPGAGAVRLGGAVLVDKERELFAFVSLSDGLALCGRDLDGLGGIKHARTAFGVVRSLLCRPCRQSFGRAGRFGSLGGSHPSPNGTEVLGDFLLFGAGFASAEPSAGGELR